MTRSSVKLFTLLVGLGAPVVAATPRAEADEAGGLPPGGLLLLVPAKHDLEAGWLLFGGVAPPLPAPRNEPQRIGRRTPDRGALVVMGRPVEQRGDRYVYEGTDWTGTIEADGTVHILERHAPWKRSAVAREEKRQFFDETEELRARIVRERTERQLRELDQRLQSLWADERLAPGDRIELIRRMWADSNGDDPAAVAARAHVTAFVRARFPRGSVEGWQVHPKNPPSGE